MGDMGNVIGGEHLFKDSEQPQLPNDSPDGPDGEVIKVFFSDGPFKGRILEDKADNMEQAGELDEINRQILELETEVWKSALWPHRVISTRRVLIKLKQRRDEIRGGPPVPPHGVV